MVILFCHFIFHLSLQSLDRSFFIHFFILFFIFCLLTYGPFCYSFIFSLFLGLYIIRIMFFFWSFLVSCSFEKCIFVTLVCSFVSFYSPFLFLLLSLFPSLSYILILIFFHGSLSIAFCLFCRFDFFSSDFTHSFISFFL